LTIGTSSFILSEKELLEPLVDESMVVIQLYYLESTIFTSLPGTLPVKMQPKQSLFHLQRYSFFSFNSIFLGLKLSVLWDSKAFNASKNRKTFSEKNSFFALEVMKNGFSNSTVHSPRNSLGFKETGGWR